MLRLKIQSLDMHIIHEVLAYVNNLNLIGYDIRGIQINTDVLLNSCTDTLVYQQKFKEKLIT